MRMILRALSGLVVAALVALSAHVAVAQNNLPGWVPGAKPGFQFQGVFGRGCASVPSWVVNCTNPPDIMFDWSNNRAWVKAGGTITTAASRVTVARASSGYVNNAAGVWTSVSANLPRISDLGLLVEELRTNSIRNNSVQGAVAGVIGSGGAMPTNWGSGTAGGCSVSVLGTGTINGIDYVDVRLFGTSSNTNLLLNGPWDSPTQIAASVGQVWTNSVFVALIGGSLSGISGIYLQTEERDGVSNLGFNTGADFKASLTPTLQRFSFIATLSKASTTFVRPALWVGQTNGSVLDITLRIGWPQLELGASVTSPIRTTSVAVTRAADVVTMTTPGAFGSAYSLYAKGTPQTPLVYTPAPLLLNVNDGSTNNRGQLQRSTTGAAQTSSISGGVSSTITRASWAQDASGKLATAVTDLDQASSFNGAAVATSSGSFPIGLNAVGFGQRSGGASSWNGFLAEAAIWYSQRVPNAQLQSMTAP